MVSLRGGAAPVGGGRILGSLRRHGHIIVNPEYEEAFVAEQLAKMQNDRGKGK